MTDLKVGLFIFKLDSFGYSGGVLSSHNQGKVRRQQKKCALFTVAAFNVSNSIRSK